MAKRISKELNKKDLQFLAYEELNKIVQDPKTSSAVKVQALTQLAKLAESLQDDTPEKPSKLSEILDE